MPKSFERALDALVQGFGAAVADIRDKGVFEAFFGLKTPERLGEPGSEREFGKAETPRSQTITVDSPGEKSPGEGLGWGKSEGRSPQPGDRPNVGFGDWLSGDVSPIAPNPDVGLGTGRDREEPGKAPDRGIDF